MYLPSGHLFFALVLNILSLCSKIYFLLSDSFKISSSDLANTSSQFVNISYMVGDSSAFSLIMASFRKAEYPSFPARIQFLTAKE